MNSFPLLVVLALVATVVALGMGVVSMARGGEYDRAHSTQFMGWRVGLQALTFVLLMLFLYGAHH